MLQWGVSQWLLSRVHWVAKSDTGRLPGLTDGVYMLAKTQPCRPAGSGSNMSQPSRRWGPGRPGGRQMVKGLNFTLQAMGSHRWNLSRRKAWLDVCFRTTVCSGKKQ